MCNALKKKKKKKWVQIIQNETTGMYIFWNEQPKCVISYGLKLIKKKNCNSSETCSYTILGSQRQNRVATLNSHLVVNDYVWWGRGAGVGWGVGAGGNEGLLGIWKFAPFISFHLRNICFHRHHFHPQVIRLDDSVTTGCRKVKCFDTELHKCQKTINLCRYCLATPVLD